MRLSILVEQCVRAVSDGLMSKQDAYNSIADYHTQNGMEIQLPKIPKDAEEDKELREFINLAHKISSKYNT